MVEIKLHAEWAKKDIPFTTCEGCKDNVIGKGFVFTINGKETGIVICQECFVKLNFCKN